MRKTLLIVSILFLISYCSFSQGITMGTAAPAPFTALEIIHTTKGLPVARMNRAAFFVINNPSAGLLIYDLAANQLMVNRGTPVVPNWQPLTYNGVVVRAKILAQIEKQQQLINDLESVNADQMNLIEDLLKRVERLEISSHTKN